MSSKHLRQVRTQGYLLDAEVRRELRQQAKRLNMGYSEVAQLAWRLARERIKKIPSDAKR